MPMDLESPNFPKLDKEEATFAATEELHRGNPEEQSPSKIVTGVLSALEPQEEVAKFETSHDRGGGGSNNVPADIVEENKEGEEGKGGGGGGTRK